MIKAVIFDIGGVLSEKGHITPFAEVYASKFGKDVEEFTRIIIENWDKARVNEIKSSLFWENLADYLKTSKEDLKKDYMDWVGFRADIFDLVKKLKKEYKLGLLSNHIEDWLGEIIKEKNFREIFDVIITSYGFKIAKPDIRIFKEMIKKLKLKPEECIYIDDLEKNIPPAKELGINTILFKNANQLKKDLEEFEIII